nr:hypothetical protein [Neorhizobium tomejilense]
MKTELTQDNNAASAENGTMTAAETIRSLAITTARLFHENNIDGANATFEKMLGIYIGQMQQPLSKAWSALPSLDGTKAMMALEYGSYEGVSPRQTAEFETSIDLRIRAAFERHIPLLRDIRGNSAVQLDTMKACVGHVMLERDKASEEMRTSSSGLLGKIRSRFMAQHGGDWNADFLRDLSPETFAHSLAHAAMGVVRGAVNGEGRPDSADEAKFLADMASIHVGDTQYKTLSLLNDVRQKTAELEYRSSSRMAFA